MTPEQIKHVNARMLSLSQTYSVVIVNGKGNISYKIRTGSAACFGNTFGFINRLGASQAAAKKVRLRVSMYTDPNANIMNCISNVVFLKREQIIQWMDELCVMFQAYGLTYKIIDTHIQLSSKGPRLSAIHIVVKAQNISHFWIKWILSYIRFMSESTCSFVLPEAFTLREYIPELKAYPVLSTFMFIWSTCATVHAFTARLIREYKPLEREYRCFVPRTMGYLIDAVSKKCQAQCAIDSWHERNFTPVYILLDLKDRPKGDSLYQVVRDYQKNSYRFLNDDYVRNYILVEKIPDNILELYKACFEKVKPSII